MTNKEEIDQAYIINAYEVCPFLRDRYSKDEKRITIGMWSIRKRIKLATIIFHKQFQSSTALAKKLNLDFNNNLLSFPQLSIDTKLWNEFISQEFAKEVDEKYSSDYIISATYTEFLLKQGFDGVIYPTVRLDGRGLNIAITTNTVDTSLKLEIVGVGCFYKDGMFTILDWEKRCIVDNPNILKYEEDPEKLGQEFCYNLLKEQKAKSV